MFFRCLKKGNAKKCNNLDASLQLMKQKVSPAFSKNYVTKFEGELFPSANITFLRLFSFHVKTGDKLNLEKNKRTE